jgi:hypothetical protein
MLRSLILRDAVEVAVGAQKYLPGGDGRRRVARFAQIIHGQKLKLVRVWPKDGRDASSACDVKPPGGHHDRTPTFAALEPLGPADFPGLTFDTLSGARSGVDDEYVSTNDYA